MNPNGTRLAAISKQLWNEWQMTRQSWRDARCQAFQQKYLDELLINVDKTVGVIEQVDKLIHKIRNDCE